MTRRISSDLARDPSPASDLVMLDGGLVVNDLNELHHPAVFVAEDVAVQDERAGEIDEARADLHVAGIDLPPLRIGERAFRVLQPGRDRNGGAPERECLALP